MLMWHTTCANDELVKVDARVVVGVGLAKRPLHFVLAHARLLPGVVSVLVGAESVVAVAISRDEVLPAQVTSSESVTDPLALSYR